jgi:type I restriction enzyme M protein
MPRASKAAAAPAPTTAQRLGGIIKSSRNIMRKDKGLSGDADRLPTLTWVMFLKFLDDQERSLEQAAELENKPYLPAIGAPYRWRDWAADPAGITGDQLIAFINNDEAAGPGGERGPGLFAYLRSLVGRDRGDRRTVIKTVFQGVANRMINGYLLRELVNKIDELHFGSTEELLTLGTFYESMLREMRDAAGDSGEFYTPRPVVRLIVEALNPVIGETVLDPAAGTGGFLVEAHDYFRRQAATVEQRQTLENNSIFGFEAKPLPYLLCEMNLLLHGVEAPRIDSGNALRFKLTELGDGDRYDVIATNPPFGGEEERGIQNNFPADLRTSETALLFLQLIMRRLRRPVGGKCGGRAGVVVPNGTLFAGGVAARLKEELLREFNLHTIVRLPNGVFAPYTSIPTNVLFFDRSGPTRDIWYYEHALPEGKRQYTKTSPMQFEEFAPLQAWWADRRENDRAWKVSADVISAEGYNLDRKNPNAATDIEHLPPEQLIAEIIAKERKILELLENVQVDLRERRLPHAARSQS